MVINEQRADFDRKFSLKQGWIYNGSDFIDYYAPHPSFHVTSHDADGHQMAHVSDCRTINVLLPFLCAYKFICGDANVHL